MRNKRRVWIVPFIIALGVIILALVSGYIIWQDIKPVPVLGELVEISRREHLLPGGKAPEYSTDPPTSGIHESQPAAAGFYESAPPDEQLVHNLEHGYVVVYYDCTLITEQTCTDLKANLQTAMKASGVAPNTQTPKIIVAPRSDMRNLITYTSWGRIYRAETFDQDEFVLFVNQNRNQAPEPRAP